MNTNTVIQIERKLVDPPPWGLHWVFPELHNSGPDYIQILDIRPFQEMPGEETAHCEKLLDQLVKSGDIVRCLNLQDGLSLVRNAGLLSPPYFEGSKIMLFKSALVGICRNTYIPFVQIIGKQNPRIYYWWIEYRIHLRFHKGLLQKL